MQLVERLNLYKNRREVALLAGPSNMICGLKTRFGSFLKDLLRFVLKTVIFRRMRIGFRHFLLESGEENNPYNPVNPV